uniref:Uncharacterized protein n=1 Tax=Meloidogyne hapla TaxID=6305 RepID=A0A1I8BW84_MELHA
MIITMDIYQKHLERISNHCLTAREEEEIYGNKSKAGLVSLFNLDILDLAIKQIGLNELRQILKLKKQKINNNGEVKEEFEDENQNDTYKVLAHFQKKVHRYSWDVLAALRFWPEDVQNAENFLDKTFPEVRQLFQLKYKEMEICKKPFDMKTTDEVLAAFINTRGIIYKAISNSTSESSSALYGNLTSKCYFENDFLKINFPS